MKKLKKSLWICVLLVVFSAMDVDAGVTEHLHGADLEEIEEIKDQILQFANDGYADLYGGEPATENDLDFENAYIVYTDANTLLNGKNSTVAYFEEALKELPVVWCIPVAYEETTCMVEVSRGLPLRDDISDILTDEQKAEIIRNEGKWTVAGAGYDEVNRQREAEAMLGSAADDIVLIGGVPGAGGLVSLVMDGQKVEGMMLLDHSLTSGQDDEIILEKGWLYSVGDFADAIAQMETTPQTVPADQIAEGADAWAGGHNGVNCLGVAGLILFAVLLVLGIRRFGLK